jgi:hypothetical protein
VKFAGFTGKLSSSANYICAESSTVQVNDFIEFFVGINRLVYTVPVITESISKIESKWLIKAPPRNPVNLSLAGIA